MRFKMLVASAVFSSLGAGLWADGKDQHEQFMLDKLLLYIRDAAMLMRCGEDAPIEEIHEMVGLIAGWRHSGFLDGELLKLYRKELDAKSLKDLAFWYEFTQTCPKSSERVRAAQAVEAIPMQIRFMTDVR